MVHYSPYADLPYIVGPAVLPNDGRLEVSRTREGRILTSISSRAPSSGPMRPYWGPWPFANKVHEGRGKTTVYLFWGKGRGLFHSKLILGSGANDWVLAWPISKNSCGEIDILAIVELGSKALWRRKSDSCSPI